MRTSVVAILLLIMLAACAQGTPIPTSVPAASPTDAPVSPTATDAPTGFPTPMPLDPALYQGWWTYTNTSYGFSVLLPEDWIVEEETSAASPLNNHLLTLQPKAGYESIRMTFRKQGEDTLLWPTGVGQGEFISQGSIEIAGEPAIRTLLVCPTGEVTAIWYQGEGQANIVRDSLEFGFIYSTGGHCEAGKTLIGKLQQVGELIIASLKLH